MSCFLVARGAGRALGCGAIVEAGDGTAEIKRMWVAPEARGLKLGQRLLDALVEQRADGGCRVFASRLEFRSRKRWVCIAAPASSKSDRSATTSPIR